ncbi:MAG: tRNA (N(6)-L-threonylcarbamoyladenosine(37)-C(2))-methylthiotransferase MtaB [Saccharofermentanales bacterium]|jgi:threonylcarbamoyladenosine tRNA methylthiotransferase MtaB
MRIALASLGCKTNQYEMDALAEALRARGAETVAPDQAADVYVLNTCTVTAEAERKARQMLRRFRRQHPEARIVACGCYAQQKDLSALADLTVGTALRDRLPDLILDGTDGRFVGPVPRVYEELGAPAVPEETRAFLKIQDGCDRRCAYCAIGIARGPARSRDLEAIAREARALARRGYREMVLTGTNLNQYDRGDGLISAIEVVDQIDGVERIRLGSLNSATITPAFAERLTRVEHLCPSFHLSLQSGSDHMLRAMGRPDTRAGYRAAVERLRRAFPDAGITTDVIVGFPGETDDDFQQTVEFCERIAFLRMHVFRYSRRPGTRAASLGSEVPKAVVHRRSEQLRRLADRLAAEAIERRMGAVREVLIETYDDRGRPQGYTPEYLFVKLDATSPAPDVGAIVRVRLVGRDGEIALGEWVDGPECE